MASHQSVKPPQTSWLAMSFGCCASRELREDGEEVRLRGGSTGLQICYNQPQTVEPPRAVPEHARPTTSHSVHQHISQWVASGREIASRASVRTSHSTVSRPRKSHSQARPSISAPTDFRRFDGLDDMVEEPVPIRRRPSFRPLELSIYLPNGRLSPLPDFTEAEWNKMPAGLEYPAQALVRSSRTDSLSSSPSSYQVQRKPIGSNRSSISSTVGRPSSLQLQQEDTQPLVPVPGSIQRSSTQGSLSSPRTLLGRLPSPSRARSNTEPAHLSRRGSLRRAKTDIDDAIRELNTIVEERRADAFRSSNPSPTPAHHIPAIAPALRMHVRSETLSDIGSAFSVPLVSKPLPTPPSASPVFNQPQYHPTIAPKPAQQKLRLVPPPLPPPPARGPLTSNPITPPTPTIPTPTTPLGRLGAWLKRSLPSSPTTPSFSPPSSSHKSTNQVPPMPFYQCEPTLSQSEHIQSQSRPATSRSHARQDSTETGMITLTSCPSTPALSSRTVSPTPDDHDFFGPGSPETPAAEKEVLGRFEVLKGEGKVRARELSEKEVEGMEMRTPISPVGVAF